MRVLKLIDLYVYFNYFIMSKKHVENSVIFKSFILQSAFSNYNVDI